MNGSVSSKQDERIEELLVLLEDMQAETEQKEKTIRQRDMEIGELQMQLKESLELCEKLNSENKAENVQALKSDLRQTRDLLQNEKEKLKRAEITIGELQDNMEQAQQEKEYAETHQRVVEKPVEKPVFYEKCRNCERMTYQKAKAQYESKSKKLDGQYKAKLAAHKIWSYGFVFYSLLTTIFMAIQSETFISDLKAFF